MSALRDALYAGSHVPVRAHSALDRLSLDAVDITEFSQVVHNAFADASWFRATRRTRRRGPERDASRPRVAGGVRRRARGNHDELRHAVRARALPGRFAHLNALLDSPPEDADVLAKLHGTASHQLSLVDLAAQKRRGLDPRWQAWLRLTFARHCVLAVGFLGADLDLGQDYLGLLHASKHTPWLGWNVRAGSAPHPRAAEVVAACGKRGHIIAGDLPDVLADLGIPVKPVPSGPDAATERVAAAVERWLTQLHLVTLNGPTGTAQHTTALTAPAREILAALKIDPPPRVTALTPA